LVRDPKHGNRPSEEVMLKTSWTVVRCNRIGSLSKPVGAYAGSPARRPVDRCVSAGGGASSPESSKSIETSVIAVTAEDPGGEAGSDTAGERRARRRGMPMTTRNGLNA
jgi:hypothetical protein